MHTLHSDQYTLWEHMAFGNSSNYVQVRILIDLSNAEAAGINVEGQLCIEVRQVMLEKW
jgi:hypothetical protein